jgi:hypothetical protein
MPGRLLRGLLGLAAAPFLLPGRALAQGGPPLLTDDPGTPGNGHWEINVAVIVDAAPGASAPVAYTYETPIIDLNYGWGARVQLKLEWPWLERAGAGGLAASGPGNPLAGVKWRFTGSGEGAGLSVSTYPQVELPSADRAVRAGLADPAGALFVPVEVREGVGPTTLDGELGYRFGDREEQALVYGLIVGEAVSKRVELLTEIHDEVAVALGGADVGESQPNLVALGLLERHDCIVNVGARLGLATHETLLLSVGHGIAIGGPPSGIQAYVGVQFVT